MWCPNGPPPPPKTRCGFSCEHGCDKCAKYSMSLFCRKNEVNCESMCGGTWCPKNPPLVKETPDPCPTGYCATWKLYRECKRLQAEGWNGACAPPRKQQQQQQQGGGLRASKEQNKRAAAFLAHVGKGVGTPPHAGQNCGFHCDGNCLMCTGWDPSGNWCDLSKTNCEGSCGGLWCKPEPVKPTKCGFDCELGCGKCGNYSTAPFCSQSKADCTQCGGTSLCV